MVDVDWYVESPQPKLRLEVDDEKAVASGLSAAHISSMVSMATAGVSAGLLHDPAAREEVPIVLRLPRERRGSLEAVQSLRFGGREPVAVREVTRAVSTEEEQSIYHKNLLPVTYVTGDVAGSIESPVYAILADEHGVVVASAAGRVQPRDLQRAPAVRQRRSTR